MTLEQLHHRNERFQQKATELADLLPGSNLLAFSSALIRSARKLDALLGKVLSAKTETSFYQQMENLEEEMDEIIFMLDKLDTTTRGRKIGMITDFVKNGYELLSLYSLCCDQLLEKKTKKEDEFE